MKALQDLTDEELFDEIREQVNSARNGRGHDRERTRAIAEEGVRRGWNNDTSVPPVTDYLTNYGHN